MSGRTGVKIARHSRLEHGETCRDGVSVTMSVSFPDEADRRVVLHEAYEAYIALCARILEPGHEPG